MDYSKCPPDAPSGYKPPETVRELISRYEAGERYFRGTDLPGGSILNGAVLAGSDFKNSWLSGVDFGSADLRNVCFDEANVKVSDFRKSDLSGASFRSAALCGATFAGAKLDDVCTEDATWYGANVTDIRILAETLK